MSTKIFVNLPVRDLQASMEFFRNLDFSFNQQFTNHEAACMVVSSDIYVMLLTHQKFAQFTPNKIAEAGKVTEVLLCLSCESRTGVDRFMKTALAYGAREVRPAEDHGFMYSRSFADPDGHIWEMMWMDEEAVEAEQPVAVASW